MIVRYPRVTKKRLWLNFSEVFRKIFCSNPAFVSSSWSRGDFLILLKYLWFAFWEMGPEIKWPKEVGIWDMCFWEGARSEMSLLYRFLGVPEDFVQLSSELVSGRTMSIVHGSVHRCAWNVKQLKTFFFPPEKKISYAFYWHKRCIAHNLQRVLKYVTHFVVNLMESPDYHRMLWLIFAELLYL